MGIRCLEPEPAELELFAAAALKKLSEVAVEEEDVEEVAPPTTAEEEEDKVPEVELDDAVPATDSDRIRFDGGGSSKADVADDDSFGVVESEDLKSKAEADVEELLVEKA